MNELLKALSENPELIDAYTTDEIVAARAALTEFTEAVKTGEVEAGSDALAEATALAGKLTEREEALVVEAEARQAEILALETALGVGPEDDDGEEGEEEEASADPVEEIMAEVPDDASEILEEEVVTAAAPRGNLKDIAARIPKERKPREETGPSLVASAAGYEGRELTASALGEMIAKRWSGMSNPSVQTMYKMASIERKHKYTLKRGDDEGNSQVLAQLTADAQANGALVASGGFCAPTEQLYGFFGLATRSGLLSLPTVNAPRGAISIPVSPSFGDFFGQSGIATQWTNANDIDPTTPATKPVYVFDCPDFQECSVSAWPTIIQAGNFAQRFYPEAIANAVGLAMIAADRTLNAARIAYLRAGAGNGVEAPNTAGSSGIWNLARVLAQNASFYRQTYAMDRTASLDVAIPHWVPEALYVDALGRGSTVDYGDLTRRISGIFSELNLRPQFVYDLDDPATAGFPGTADLLMWAPGTVVELDAGTLDLGVVRDSTLNATNDFQTFVEPFVGWCQPGHDVILMDEVVVCSTGATGAAISLGC